MFKNKITKAFFLCLKERQTIELKKKAIYRFSKHIYPEHKQNTPKTNNSVSARGVWAVARPPWTEL